MQRSDDTENQSEDAGESENIDDEDVGKLVQKKKDVETSKSSKNASSLYRGFSLDIRSVIQKAGKDIYPRFKKKFPFVARGRKNEYACQTSCLQ